MKAPFSTSSPLMVVPLLVLVDSSLLDDSSVPARVSTDCCFKKNAAVVRCLYEFPLERREVMGAGKRFEIPPPVLPVFNH